MPPKKPNGFSEFTENMFWAKELFSNDFKIGNIKSNTKQSKTLKMALKLPEKKTELILLLPPKKRKHVPAKPNFCPLSLMKRS